MNNTENPQNNLDNEQNEQTPYQPTTPYQPSESYQSPQSETEPPISEETSATTPQPEVQASYTPVPPAPQPEVQASYTPVPPAPQSNQYNQPQQGNWGANPNQPSQYNQPQQGNWGANPNQPNQYNQPQQGNWGANSNQPNQYNQPQQGNWGANPNQPNQYNQYSGWNTNANQYVRPQNGSWGGTPYPQQQTGWNSGSLYNTAPQTPYEIEQTKNKFFKRACNIAAGSSLFMTLGQIAVSFIISYIVGIYIGIQTGLTGFDSLDFLYSPIFLFATTMIAALLGNSVGILYGSAKYKIKMGSLFTKSSVGFGTLVVLCIMALGVNTFASYAVTFIDYLLQQVGLSVPMDNLFMGATDPLAAIFLSITTVIIAPITEEILFRGVILKALSKYSTVFAAIASSLLFGLIHGNIPQAIFAFLIGIIMSYITIKTGSIIPAIIIHAFNNLFATGTSLLVAYNIAPEIVNIVYTIVSLSCLLVTIIILIVKARNISFKNSDENARQSENFITIHGKWGKFFSSGAVIAFLIYTLGTILFTILAQNVSF